MKKPKRRLGDARATILLAIQEHDGKWTPGERLSPQFGTYWTEQIVYSLVSYGMLTYRKDGCYHITANGREAADNHRYGRAR